MFNSNLKTQPLDPKVLQSLEPSPPRSQVPATAPLREPSLLSDRIQTQAPPSGVPAQSISLAAPSPQLSGQEATLLLNISEKLGNLYKTDKASFQNAMQALESVTRSGNVDFSCLSAQQQQLLSSLGLTSQNTAQVYQQLYQLLLPTQQSQTSNAFQTVQSSVTSFLSNIDLKQQTFHQIETQARDLSCIQGVVSNLSASSIQNLLADQTAGVFDLAVSKITSQNFNIQSGMDYTLGHFVVLSQDSPQTLQAVEGILQKVRSDQAVSPQDRQLLNKYGLNITPENKLETLERKPLSLQEVQNLESVVYSMQDPSQDYQKVLLASADVIRQSKKLEELGQRATFEVAQVQKTTTEVVTQNQALLQTHQDTNQINAKLQTAQSQAQQLQTVITSSPSLSVGAAASPSLDISPIFLAQWNIRIEKGAEGSKIFIGNRQASPLELMQYLGQLLQEQQATIQSMAADLARKKSEALKATANLAQSTQKLETQTEQLENTRKEIQTETLKLQDLELVRLDVIKEASPHLKPEELELVKTVIDPAVKQTVKTVQTKIAKLDQEIGKTLQAAHQAIQESQSVQEMVTRDARRWEQTLSQAHDLDQSIDQTLAKLPSVKTDKPSSEKVAEENKLQAQPEEYQSPSLLPENTDFEADPLKLKQSEQRKAEKSIEQGHMERKHQQEIQEEARQAERLNQKRADLDKEIFQQEQKRLRKEEI
ncbi:hypothetical protein COW36_19955 [bacterium (Candidatus Blackallbacteria) CG17_big_fil_post_rev_8_21_14_2_50_48_46]|uniref:Uncharacterized protein n=1 Tax=bacterium (Candidatus Blackallbacteria) CG17_big_fil_post_rev_8_21_14_2_50_48_46 TaxID=2014261 RepID=A0A2M7G037_9BACT|nr:MAG: hypothetical protein COW64_15340 [bacterium (Candidatus Blackallbacteria) CG18_big_fil_WC_8_21_14_2_50_49_26]PIW14923.1 MAG: hypothetical protein COW36_19955 [bacterium (Candidatus Blackallbacteria) CG17_big_fil_post_rev_8_21_14_2_50_48_46]PIW44289.1 MAG: hypothetical protein COW20_24405 [bacterium (Candidatus Blackallbacteria) CG13_big_fil_rev_8_21_14_2_50_49_14]